MPKYLGMLDYFASTAHATSNLGKSSKILTTVTGAVLLLCLPPVASASNLYSYSLNIPSSFPNLGASTVSWSFSVPSILTNTTFIPGPSLSTQSVGGVIASLGCKIIAAQISTPAFTGTTWGVTTYFSCASVPYFTTNGFPSPLTSSGVYTTTQTTLNASLTIGPSIAGLAQVATGGTLTTGIYISNTGAVPASFSIKFYDDNGAPLTLPFTGGSVNVLSGTLPGGGSAYYEAGNNPQSPVSQGWAQISSDSSIVVQGLFRNFVGGTNYEAAIPSITGGSSDLLFPFDDTTFAPTGQSLVTGIAIANADNVAASISCVARDPNGVIILNAMPVPMLPPLGHWAGYQFPALAGLRGTVECTSNTNIAATALRFLGSAISSLPVVAK